MWVETAGSCLGLDFEWHRLRQSVSGICPARRVADVYELCG